MEKSYKITALVELQNLKQQDINDIKKLQISQLFIYFNKKIFIKFPYYYFY